MSSRAHFRQFVETPVDIVVVGGGITGAGILLAAAQAGYRAALIEQHDFSWGSSSRSSKLVHGGMRYLKYGKVALTALSLRERDQLLHDYPDLTSGLRFFLPYSQKAPLGMRAGIRLYDGLAEHETRAHYNRAQLQQLFPFLRDEYRGALSYVDGQTDDAQLVLRVLQQARQLGAVACNYCAANELMVGNNTIHGVVANDRVSGASFAITAKMVINATGAWATRWLQNRPPVSLKSIKLKPLRGSHLVLPFYRLPLTQAMALMHPIDERPMFALPWGGEVIFGTTDVEHVADLNEEPAIDSREFDYLLDALRRQFPSLNLDANDVISTYSGVRPTVDDGHKKASAISREHCIAEQNGLITIAGGKLTTFRYMAKQILQRVTKQIGYPQTLPLPAITLPTPLTRQRDPLSGLQHDVVHLDDWLLRRTHIGLMSEQGGVPQLSLWQQTICRQLKWDETRWQTEMQRFRMLYQKSYSVPGRLGCE